MLAPSIAASGCDTMRKGDRTMARDESRGGCGKFFAWGCGCLVVVLFLIGLVVLLNLGRIRSAVSGVKETVGEALAVRAAVQDEFGVEGVEVKIRRGPDTDGTVLGVQLVDPPFILEREEVLEQKARQVAALTKSLLEDPSAWAGVEVVFTRGHSVGVTFSTASRFMFRMDEIPDVRDGPEDDRGAARQDDRTVRSYPRFGESQRSASSRAMPLRAA